MLSETQGIVIQARKYGDTSLIAHIFTREFGMQGFLVKGVYRRKSAFSPSYFQHLNRLQLVMYYKSQRQLQNLKELRVSPLFHQVPYQIEKTSMAMFLAELLGKVLQDEEPNDPLFLFLEQSIQALDDWEGSLSLFPLLFLIDLTRFMGFQPHNNYSSATSFFNLEEGCFQAMQTNDEVVLPANESYYLAELLPCGLSDPGDHAIPYAERLSLLDQMVDYFRLHTQHFTRLRSAQVLREVLQG